MNKSCTAKCVFVAVSGLSLMLLAGCTDTISSPFYARTLPNGDRGFSHSDFVQGASSEETARNEIQRRFDMACGVKAQIIDLQLIRADSLGGFPHIGYSAEADCVGLKAGNAPGIIEQNDQTIWQSRQRASGKAQVE